MKIAKTYALAAIATAAFAFASCSDVTDPAFKAPDAADFTIFTPPLQNEYFELSPNGTFEIVLSGQPDYGFSAITQYRLDVSMTADFKDDNPDTPVDECNYRTLTPTGTGTLSRMTLKMEDLAIAMNELNGVTAESNYVDRGIEKVYLRGRAYISGVEESLVVTNNCVSLNSVQCYYTLRLPNYIYCIGNYPGGWSDGGSPDAANADKLAPFRIMEKDNEIGSNMFYGNVDFQTEAPMFRFYTGLNGWDKPADFDGTGKTGPAAFFSLGCAGGEDSDKPVVFDEFVEGSTLTHALAETKDSFSFPNYAGVVYMVVDLTDVENPVATFTTQP